MSSTRACRRSTERDCTPASPPGSRPPARAGTTRSRRSHTTIRKRSSPRSLCSPGVERMRSSPSFARGSSLPSPLRGTCGRPLRHRRGACTAPTAAELAPEDAELWRAIARASSLRFNGESYSEAMLKAIELTTDSVILGHLYAELVIESTMRGAMWKQSPDGALLSSCTNQALELAAPESRALARRCCGGASEVYVALADRPSPSPICSARRASLRCIPHRSPSLW